MDINSLVTSIIIAVVTASIATFFTSREILKKARADLENEFSSRFNTRKWDVYTEFTKFLHKSVNENHNRPDISDMISIDEELVLLASQIMIAGSDKVVNAFRIWRESIQVYGLGDEKTRNRLLLLVIEMRKDLGNKHTNLEISYLFGALRLDSSN